MAAHGVIFAVPPFPLPVLIAFVAGDINNRSYGFCLPAHFKNVQRPHHIGGICFYRIAIRCAYQRLGREMKNNFRLKSAEYVLQSLNIADVCNLRTNIQIQQTPVRRVGRSGQRIPTNVRAQSLKPESQPTALEPGMASQKNLLTLINVAKSHIQLLIHGAAPEIP